MIFEQFTAGGCQSYLVGCAESCAAALIDPEISLIDRYLALAARDGLRIRYLVDTHTHADHFSATRQLAKQLDAPVAMHRMSPAPFVTLALDDGEMLAVGKLRLQVLHTPGHTRDSMCLVVEDRVFTGDTLLIGATGRTDLPSGDPGSLYESLFDRLLRLEPAMKVHPAHEYKGRTHTTIGDELANNPRLKVRDRTAFIEMMRNLNLKMPTHITEALRTNLSGGKTVAQMLTEAAANVPFMSLAELGPERGAQWRAADSRRTRARRVRAGSHPGRQTAAARAARAAGESGASGSNSENGRLLRARSHIDSCGGDAARNGLSANRRARRRHASLARGRLSAQGGDRSLSSKIAQ